MKRKLTIIILLVSFVLVVFSPAWSANPPGIKVRQEDRNEDDPWSGIESMGNQDGENVLTLGNQDNSTISIPDNSSDIFRNIIDLIPANIFIIYITKQLDSYEADR